MPWSTRRYWLTVLALSWWLVVFPNPIRASSSLLFAETFDWYGLQRWTETYNGQWLDPTLPCRSRSSDHISWEAVNGQAKLNINGSVPCKVVLQPDLQTELPSKWQARFQFQPLSHQADYNWLVKWQDQDNYLGFHLFNNWLYAEKIVNGVNYAIVPSQQYLPIKKDHVYQVAMSYDQLARTIAVQVDDQQPMMFSEALSDPALTAGLPGLAGSVGAGQNTSAVAYDNWQIWELESTTRTILDVPLLKQTDPRWSNQEYNSALTWSPENPHVSRWGCALTSAAMLFQYFGLNTMPNGEPLSPGTLNDWLKSQPDGYVAEGLLNWRALSRLSWQIQAQWNTPALEFKYEALPPDPLNWLQVQLWRQLPIILALPGHFVVAHGVTNDSKVQIRDPYYAYTNLVPYQNSWLSARLFTPSQTDLSAISIWAKPGVALKLADQSIMPILESYPQGEWWVYDLPKPAIGLHSLSITNLSQAAQPALIQVYDQFGSVIEQSLLIPPQATEYQVKVDLHPDAPVKIDWEPINYQYSLTELVTLLRHDELSSPFLLGSILSQQIELSQNISLEQAESVLNSTLDSLAGWHERQWLSYQAKELIKQLLQAQLRQAWP